MITFHQRVLRLFRRLFSGDPAQRRIVRYSFAEFMARSICPIYIGGDLKAWLDDTAFHDSFRKFSPKSNRMAERTYTVRELVRSIDHVSGDTAEVGAFQGKTSYFIRQARRRSEHHIFDSFQGLSNPTADDTPEDHKALHWKRGDLSAGEQLVRDNLAEFDGVHFYEGWIPERFGEVADRRFAFVHVDVDLYQPTLESVAFFYPRLNPGGMLVCDDYGFTSCPGAYKAMHEVLDERPEHIIHLPTGQGVVIKQ